MSEIKLITLDLDGTLLNSHKELTPGNFAALQRAVDCGIEIVPTTGRFFGAMPEVIRQLPFLHYAITINGAQVYDVRRDAAISKAELSVETAVSIMEFLDTLPVIYDCFIGNWGWMTRSLQEKSAEYAPDEHFLKMLLELRRPVDELKAYVRERGEGVQKVQFFTKDLSIRARMLHEIPERFPETVASSAVVNNLEINHCDAHKGVAIQRLAEHLGIGMESVLAFGDGLNDLTMLRAAGIGVCMENGVPEAKEAADAVTASCDEDGVAKAILKYVFGE